MASQSPRSRLRAVSVGNTAEPDHERELVATRWLKNFMQKKKKKKKKKKIATAKKDNDRRRTSSVLIAMATAEPSPAAVITCARGFVALPAAQTPGTLVGPSRSTWRSPSSLQVAAERGGETVLGVRAHRGADEERVAGR